MYYVQDNLSCEAARGHRLSRREVLAASICGALALSAKATQIKVGCQANAWPLKEGDFDQLIDAIQDMKKLGYVGFECNLRFVRGQFPQSSEARKRIEDTGVQFIGAHMSVQQAGQDVFPSIVSGAAALGAEYIVMSSSGLSADGKFSRDALANKAMQLETLGKACRAGKIQLAYHNHNPEFTNNNAEIDALAESTDPELVSFLMDAGHGYLGGGDPPAFMSQYSKRIVGCHIKTFRGKMQVPLGQGDFGFESLAAAIRKTGWTGWLIDEEGGGAKSGDTGAVGPDRKYIRRVFGA